MVYLNKLFPNVKIGLDNYIIMKLQIGSSTRDVANELQVTQSQNANDL